jgi:hypothetical protein
LLGDRTAGQAGRALSATPGYYLITISEGRRLAQRLRAKRGEIRKTHEAAERIRGLRKLDMATEAEALITGKGWLPSLLRAPTPVEPEVQPEAPSLTDEAA